MEYDKVLKTLVERSGKTYRAVSRELGKSPNWTGVTVQAGRDPKLSTVAAIAEVAGCSVQVVDKQTGAIVATVTPPRRAAGEDAELGN